MHSISALISYHHNPLYLIIDATARDNVAVVMIGEVALHKLPALQVP